MATKVKKNQRIRSKNMHMSTPQGLLHHCHRVIILNRGSMPRKRTEESDAILPDRSVQRHSVTSLEAARSLANGPS